MNISYTFSINNATNFFIQGKSPTLLYFLRDWKLECSFLSEIHYGKGLVINLYVMEEISKTVFFNGRLVVGDLDSI